MTDSLAEGDTGRTIHELIATVCAGDWITQADADRLSRHLHHNRHIDTILIRGGVA